MEAAHSREAALACHFRFGVDEIKTVGRIAKLCHNVETCTRTGRDRCSVMPHFLSGTDLAIPDFGEKFPVADGERALLRRYCRKDGFVPTIDHPVPPKLMPIPAF